MWIFLVLVGLPSLGLGLPLNALRLPAPSKNDSSPDLWSTSTSPAPAVTPTTLPPHSEAPALSLNLGLNFKIKVRSQGKGQVGEGARGATADPRLPPAHSQAPGSRFWAEALGGSGWLGPGPAEELPSGPGGWAWEGSPVPAEASSPTPQLPLTLWPRLTKKGLAVPVAGEDGSELEFKIDIDLTAGVGKEGSLAPNSSSPGRHLPRLPGLRVGIAEVASKWWESPGLFGSRLPPVTWEPPEQNATGSTWEPPGHSPRTPEGASEPGAESSSPAASAGSEGAFAAAPGCWRERPEECGAGVEGSGPWALLLLAPGLPVPVALRAGRGGAPAGWGAAWQAQLLGAGALSGLLAALALGALAAAPCPRPPDARPTRRLLALLALLLAGAGGARAALLLGEAGGRRAALPELPLRLLHELPPPCLASALALAARLLARRPPPPKRPPPPCRPAAAAAACCLALPLLLHWAAGGAGAALAAARRPQAPLVLLAARGLWALLGALLSAALLAAACRSPLAGARRCALPAALAGLLGAALHAYGLLQALGGGRRAARLAPWPWWALQLAGRLAEAGVGLPLALLALRPLLAAPADGPCCARRSPQRLAAKAPALPAAGPWAPGPPRDQPPPPPPPEGPQARYLPLHAPPASPARLSLTLDADPTDDFRPPSPIDLSRSIDEALCSEGLFPGPGGGGPAPLAASSTLSLRCARPRPSDAHLFRTASCLELAPARTPDDASSSPALSPSPPGSARLLPGAREGGGGSPPPRSPPPPARQAWPLAPASQEALASAGQPGPPRGAAAALLHEEFLDVCRQIDALSVGSDTIDL